jgi:hypothetical protein
MIPRWIPLVATLVCACGDDPVVRPTGMPPLGEPPAYMVGGFSITMPETQLASGEEREPCWIFPIEIHGPSHIVGGAVLRTPPGMHHGNITTRPKTGEGVRACEPGAGNSGTDIIGGGSVLFASSTQVQGEEWYRFPDGDGYRVNDQFELVARMHYLNPSDAAITIAPSYEWFTIDETKLVHELGAFAWVYQGFEIPPLQQLTVTADCSLPNNHPMHVLTVLPHMHKLGRAMTASYVGGPLDGERFLDSQGYDPERGVLLQYEPAVDLSDATGITFSCTWQNTLDKKIVEGIGDNEMCILFGYAWPVERSFSAIASPGNCLMVATPPPG